MTGCPPAANMDCMKADDLTREQARVLCERVNEMAIYLMRLRKRMYELKFPEDDPLYFLVGEARAAVHALWLDLHSRSASGIIRPPAV